MNSYSVCGSNDRWFYAIWAGDNPNQKPFSWGYASSKLEALDKISLVCTVASKQLQSSAAKQWRGLLGECRYCGSRSNYVSSGSGQHHASLYCSDCGQFLKWLSFEQCELLQRRQAS